MPADQPAPHDSSQHRRPSDAALDRLAAADSRQAGAEEPSDGVAGAKTVIRGSSRVPPAGGLRQQTPAVVAKVLVGQRLNQYLIEQLIGGGGMGAVFRAHDDRLDRTVAIKVIPFVSDDPDLQRRFRNEAQSAAKLDHPGIARVYDAGNHHEWHYIVFEYINGTNIRDRVLSSGVLTIDQAVYYTAQLAAAIEHASSRGIVHRDIKPSNVIVGDDDNLKLVDMGLARSEHLELSDDMTASGVTLGTFDYISPEQAHDPRGADVRSDIYSLGCTLYFMLTGSPPYPGGTMAQKIISHGTAPPPNVQPIRPAVSDHLATVLNKMLAKSPHDRYRSANDLLADLREVARRDGLRKSYEFGPLPATGAARAPSPFDRYLPWVAAFLLIMLSAGWLRLESAALRQEPVVPKTASAPVDLTDAAPSRPALVDARSQDGGKQVAKSQGDVQPSTEQLSRQPQDDIDDSQSEVSPGRDIDPDSQPEPVAVPPVGQVSAAGEPTRDGSRPAAPLEGASSLLGNAEAVRVVDQTSGRQRDEDGALLASSLPQAVGLAARSGSGRIEIATPSLVSEPLKIDVDQPLIIRSSVGGSAILFRNGSSGTEAPPPVWIDSGQVEIQDLHLTWNRRLGPNMAPEMIRLSGDCDVHLVRCSLTIPGPIVGRCVALSIDADDSRPPASESSESSGVAEAVADVDGAPGATRIELRDSVVRGDMTMLSTGSRSGGPLERRVELTWDNGLLAVTGRMIQASGTRVDQSGRPMGSIELDLSRLTAHVPRGLVQIRLGPEASVSTPIDRQSSQSLYLVGAEFPHFEYRGLATLEDWPEVLLMRGTDNWYATNRRWLDPMLRLVTVGGRASITAMQQIGSQRPWWLQDRGQLWTIPSWTNPEFQQIPASRRTADDYRHDAETEAGLDVAALPQIPTPLGGSAGNGQSGFSDTVGP